MRKTAFRSINGFGRKRFQAALVGAVTGPLAHFTASFWSRSTLSHRRHTSPVRPSDVATAFIRFLQCGQSVKSMNILPFPANGSLE
ncbi:MAG TPA: hypothetical protein VD863_28150 [Bradyrhizobium sp.]|jgi:hypothetical protein|nr:hypothetical protein [Bradyrhizobium sp.]